MENLLKNFLGEKLSIRKINGKGRATIIFTTNYLTSEDIERFKNCTYINSFTSVVYPHRYTIDIQ